MMQMSPTDWSDFLQMTIALVNIDGILSLCSTDNKDLGNDLDVKAVICHAKSIKWGSNWQF